MIDLLSIKFGNIRSFDKEQTIDFKNRSKLIQIDGINENTGGSSGAGKTTVGIAIDYLLGLNDIPTTILQSRYTKSPLFAEGNFLIDDQLVHISRSKKNGLIIKTPQETVSGNAKLAEEKLEELIGIPKKIFKKMIHKKQKEGGFFLNMSPKEMYSFLTSVLGLEKYIKQIEIINENIKRYKEELIKLNNDIEHLKKLDDVYLDNLSQLSIPVCSINKEHLTQTKKNIEDYKEKINNLKEERKGKISSIQRPIKQETSIDSSELTKLSKQLIDIKNNILNLESDKKALLNKVNSIAVLKNQIQNLIEKMQNLKVKQNTLKEESKCPTCKRQWDGILAQQELDKTTNEIKTLTNKILSYKTEITQEKVYNDLVTEKNQQISTLNSEKEPLQLRISSIQIEQQNIYQKQENEFKLKLSEYQNSVLNVKNEYNDSINGLMEKYNNLITDYKQKTFELNSYNQKKQEYEKHFEQINNSISINKQKLNDTENRIKLLNRETLIAQECQRLIRTYTLRVFQETLDLIGDTATNILSFIPNTDTVTIYFEGCKETKSGSIKNEINPIVNVGGNHGIPIKSLSGGERTAIELAVDLAVIDVIESKANKGAAFFVLDEPFDGLDSVCKENCLEIFKQIDTNKKIIIIDHSSELKQMVSDVINVIKIGESSTVAC